MKPTTTNIFCLIGKPGSGRETLLRSIMSDTEFISKFDLEKLVYGTTRAIKPGDIEGETYHFFTKEEYDNIDSDEFIESRSYDIICTNEVNWFFTLKSYIQFGTNYIAKTSTFQYSELKKWGTITQLKNPMMRINIYPIMINTPIFEREKRIMKQASVEQDIYNMCSKFITEKFEFKAAIEQNPELIDTMNRDTCILDNSKSGKHHILLLTAELKKFIGERLILQEL